MKGRLARLIQPERGWRGAWLLPFIHVLLESGEASVGEVARRLSVRTRVVKSAFYALRKAGVITKVESDEAVRYRLVEGVAEEYRRLVRVAKLEGDYAAFTGSHYIFVDVKRSRVSYWVLPAMLVEKVVEEYRKSPELRPSELGRRLGLHGRTVSRALRVYKFLHGEA